MLRSCALLAPPLFALAACSSSEGAPPLPPEDLACAGPCPASNVKHLVVIIQENHTFDDHFGRYCTAPPGSSPTCTDGPACCEAMPATDPAGNAPVVLDDAAHAGHDPDHTSACETAEIDQGKMDAYATASCGSPLNVAVAAPDVIAPLWQLARDGAIADRYFQSIVGASSANDMYLARAQFVFDDNDEAPKGAVGMRCELESAPAEHTDQTIGDLLRAAGVPWTFYADGYDVMKRAEASGTCPPRPDGCAFPLPLYPCNFDPSDVPFEYYPTSRDDPSAMQDLSAFYAALDQGGLPAVSYVKAIGWQSEHPGHGIKLSDGVGFVKKVTDAVMRSRYRGDTLVLVTYDESGGYFDHVPPPPASPVDGKPYGPRIPMIAVGPFARKNHVSHVVMEHSSIVKLVEWNWLGMKTGQLGGRDTVVANMGSLLDPAATGVAVPED